MARIVFDLDGTLIDSAPDIRGVANSLLAQRGYEPLTLAETKSFIGNGAGVFVSQMRAARQIPDNHQDQLLAEFVGCYETAVTLTNPYPQVLTTLHSLLDAGHTLGICTNKPVQPAMQVLAYLKMAAFFEVVLGGDSMSRRKPDPMPLNAAFDALGSGPRVYVGDSEVDAATAEAAQVPFLLFTEGYRKTAIGDITHRSAFGDFAALPDLIDELPTV